MGPRRFNVSCSRLSGVLENVTVRIYIDDIIVFSGTVKDHMRHLRLVFDLLQDVCLKLYPANCDFASPRVVYVPGPCDYCGGNSAKP